MKTKADEQMFIYSQQSYPKLSCSFEISRDLSLIINSIFICVQSVVLVDSFAGHFSKEALLTQETQALHHKNNSLPLLFCQAMESKLLVGGKNIIDHTNEQQKMLEMKRHEIAEQVNLCVTACVLRLFFWCGFTGVLAGV